MLHPETGIIEAVTIVKCHIHCAPLAYDSIHIGDCDPFIIVQELLALFAILSLYGTRSVVFGHRVGALRHKSTVHQRVVRYKKEGRFWGSS